MVLRRTTGDRDEHQQARSELNPIELKVAKPN
jgi:hypothetical protein